MAFPQSSHLTLDEFLAWEETQELRHEFVDGEVFAMVGATRTHNTIVLNLCFDRMRILEVVDTPDAVARVLHGAAASRGRAFAVVYLSNAEETLAARERLFKNLSALPRATGALLLRTSGNPDVPAVDGLRSYESATLADVTAGTAPG